MIRPRLRPGAGIAAAAVLALLLPQGTVLAQDASPVLEVAVPPGPPAASAAGLGLPPGIRLALVEGGSGQTLVARGETERRPVASAIKLVTALVVTEEIPPGTWITVGEEVTGVEGSSYGLQPGEVRSVEDLLAGLLLRSGNDAAVALAVATAGSEEAFVGRMETALAAMGIEARPGSSSGLDPEDALSANDLATVARVALREPRIRTLVAATLLEVDGVEIENRNLFLGDIPGATGLKTGFTSAAGFTLAASARRDGRELVAVVLGAADDLERRTAASALLEYGFNATVPVTLEETLTLRTSSGPVLLSTSPVLITVREGQETGVAWPQRIRPDGVPDTVGVLVDGIAAGSVELERRDGRRTDGSLSLGRALADGAYAALRPVGLGGEAPAPLR